MCGENTNAPVDGANDSPHDEHRNSIGPVRVGAPDVPRRSRPNHIWTATTGTRSRATPTATSNVPPDGPYPASPTRRSVGGTDTTRASRESRAPSAGANPGPCWCSMTPLRSAKYSHRGEDEGGHDLGDDGDEDEQLRGRRGVGLARQPVMARDLGRKAGPDGEEGEELDDGTGRSGGDDPTPGATDAPRRGPGRPARPRRGGRSTGTPGRGAERHGRGGRWRHDRERAERLGEGADLGEDVPARGVSS